jgi:hypothetical protein
MVKLSKYITLILALVVVLSSCTKDEELMQTATEKGLVKSYEAGDDTESEDLGDGPSSLPGNSGGPIVDDEDDENDDDGGSITDDEDDENDDDSSNRKVQG